jgi:hypothetical protein
LYEVLNCGQGGVEAAAVALPDGGVAVVEGVERQDGALTALETPEQRPECGS